MEVSAISAIENIQSELHEGMSLTKCRKCGCMKETLENLQASLDLLQTEGCSDLLKNVNIGLTKMEPIKYACLGCEYCFPAVATNIFNQGFPEISETLSLSCGFEVREQIWPPVPGEYFAFCEGSDCSVAVSTLASVELAEALANRRPKELCIVGKTETENIGVDKLIKNTVTNPNIRVLLLVGKEPKGHRTGRTLLSLRDNGVDENMRVIGSPGKRPVLRNVTTKEVEAFRKQIQFVDMIGCEDVETIVKRVKDVARDVGPLCSCQNGEEALEDAQISPVPKIQAKGPVKIELDKSGYFVIIPQPKKGIITIEHYSYDNKLQHVIEGTDARSLYWTIIENDLVTQLSHAAYLGKELAKAELSIERGFKYIQDGA